MSRRNLLRGLAQGSLIVGFGATWLRAGAQPAPPLTNLQVYAVRSATYTAWDYVQPWNLATNRNHGGSWLEVVTLETGYASSSSRRATFAGSTMQKTGEQALTDSNRRLWGRLVWWRYNGSFVSGTVRVQATSSVFPYNTYTDWINVL